MPKEIVLIIVGGAFQIVSGWWTPTGASTVGGVPTAHVKPGIATILIAP